jgi:hypothetical protein
MSTLNATTPQAFAVEQIAQMVAECEEFQDEAGVTSADDALEFISYPEYIIPQAFSDPQITKPFAVVYHKSFSRSEVGDGTTMPRGEVFLQLGRPILNYDDAKREETLFSNFAGAITDRVLELSRDGTGRLHITGIADVVAPRRSAPEHESMLGAQKPYYFAEYVISWDPIG